MKTKQNKAMLAKIEHLFEMADKNFSKDPKLSNRYVFLARELSSKTQTRIPRGLKRKYCKKCNSYLKSPYNLRIRIQNNKVIYFCKICKSFARFSLVKK